KNKLKYNIMTELLIIKTASTEKLKSILAKNHIEHEIIYNQLLVDKKPTKKDKLREYIEMKSKENIFADYGEAIKDKEREKEIAL
ncbi:9995_t:CDS:1, partial [Racocetra persica]